MQEDIRYQVWYLHSTTAADRIQTSAEGYKVPRYLMCTRNSYLIHPGLGSSPGPRQLQLQPWKAGPSGGRIMGDAPGRLALRARFLRPQCLVPLLLRVLLRLLLYLSYAQTSALISSR